MIRIHFGFEQAVQFGGETKHPQRNIPIAVIGSVAVASLLYMLLQLAYVVSVPTASPTGRSSTNQLLPPSRLMITAGARSLSMSAAMQVSFGRHWSVLEPAPSPAPALSPSWPPNGREQRCLVHVASAPISLSRATRREGKTSAGERPGCCDLARRSVSARVSMRRSWAIEVKTIWVVAGGPGCAIAVSSR